jgi:hypothetical protein
MAVEIFNKLEEVKCSSPGMELDKGCDCILRRRVRTSRGVENIVSVKANACVSRRYAGAKTSASCLTGVLAEARAQSYRVK